MVEGNYLLPLAPAPPPVISLILSSSPQNIFSQQMHYRLCKSDFKTSLLAGVLGNYVEMSEKKGVSGRLSQGGEFIGGQYWGEYQRELMV